MSGGYCCNIFDVTMVAGVTSAKVWKEVGALLCGGRALWSRLRVQDMSRNLSVPGYGGILMSLAEVGLSHACRKRDALDMESTCSWVLYN